MAKSLDKSDAKKERIETIHKEVPAAVAVKQQPAVPVRDPARESALGRAVQQIEKQFGKGSVMKLDDNVKPIEGIPTGSLSLDIALGGSGIPKGRVCEIY